MALQYKFNVESIIKEGRITRNQIEEIREWIQTASLPQIPNEMIALFLLSCSCDLTATRDTIQNYFKRKIEAPELFQNRDVDDERLQKAMKVITCVSIPRRMPNNTVIHFFRLMDTNYKHFDLEAAAKLAFMLVDVSQRYDPPNDLVVVVDMQGSSLLHLTTLKLGIIRKFLNFMQEALPLKIKNIHVLNSNYIFDRALAMAKVYLRGDLIQQIVTHSSKEKMETFHRNHIPAECLPHEYGGELDTCKVLNQYMIQQFRELKEFYQVEEELVRSYTRVSRCSCE